MIFLFYARIKSTTEIRCFKTKLLCILCIRRCTFTSTCYLPGLGFDALRNLNMGQVFTYNYSMCKETADGKFLIPDSVSAFPLKQHQYKLHADIFEHWSDYMTISSSKINMGVPVFGAFSEEKMAVREKQEKHNTVTVRTMFRNRVYEVKLDVLSEPHPAFKSKVYEIASHVR